MSYLPLNTARQMNAIAVRKHLGDLAGKKSRAVMSGQIMQRQQAEAALQRLPSLQNKLDNALMQVEQGISTASNQVEVVRNALESSTGGYNLVTRLDRPADMLSTIAEQVEALRSVGANYPTAIREGGAGGEQDVVDIINAEAGLNASLGKIKPLIGQINSIMGQIKSVAAQAQAVVAKEQQAAAAQARAEQAAIDAENRRIMQEEARAQAQIAAENARMQAQIQLEQQRMQLEQQAALAPIQAQLAQQQAQQQADLIAQQQAQALAQQQAQLAAQQAYMASQPIITGAPQSHYGATYAEMPGGYQSPGQQIYNQPAQSGHLPPGWTGQEAAARAAQQGPAPVDATSNYPGGYGGSWYQPGFELFGMPGMSGMGGLGAVPGVGRPVPQNLAPVSRIPSAAQVQSIINAAAPLIPGMQQAPAPEPEPESPVNFASIALGALAAWLLPKAMTAMGKRGRKSK